MIPVRQLIACAVGVALAGTLGRPVSGQTQAQAPPSPLVGAWTLNKDLSDGPAERTREGGGTGERGRRGGGGGGGGRRGGFGGGGFGGGGRGGGAANRPPMDPEEMARMRDAIRDIMTAAPHLTVVQTDSMVIVTSGEGRTTRLSADGKKIKDESTKIERKTHWDGAKLVSEISGLPNGKVVETFAVDPESHQLHITMQREGKDTRTVTWIYDRDA